METTVASSGTGARLALGRRYGHYFFSGMAILMLCTVALGFAKTYYLAGLFRAPLPSWVIHVHGAAFSFWILLFVTQTSLVAAHRVDLHRRLGLAAFGWSCLMVVLGVMAATDLLLRGVVVGGVDPRTFYAGTILDIVMFAVLVLAAFSTRSVAPTHKRFALLATISLMGPAIGRWPFPFIQENPQATDAILYGFVLLLVAYDLLTLRKVYRATIMGAIFIIAVQRLELPVGRSNLWQSIAVWVEGLAKSLHSS